jgi:hypothetical protein
LAILNRQSDVLPALKAGLAYFAVVFSAGFALGAIRFLIVSPRIGELPAVLLELPLMLMVSWTASRWLIRSFNVNGELTARLVMGAFAFGLVMMAEAALSVFGFGRTISEHLEAFRAIPVLLGLAGQVAFAIFPVLQRA